MRQEHAVKTSLRIPEEKRLQGYLSARAGRNKDKRENPGNHITPAAETLLYMAARAQVVDQIVKPALLKGKIVICDRFLDSTIAYQGYGLGIDINMIKCIGNFATGGIKPDLTILLDLPVQEGLKYRKLSKDRIEKRSYAYHIAVIKGYLGLAKSEPERIKIVKVDRDKNTTQKKIRELIEKYVV